MLNEKKIIKVKISNNIHQDLDKLLTFSDNTSRLYYDILKKTTESLWWHCISIIFQYIYLIFFLINDNVS